MQNTSTATAAFPAWIFVAPSSVIAQGLSFAVFGQDPESKTWLYWDAAAASYSSFSGLNGYTSAPLIALPASGSYSLALPAQQAIQSGVVVMFIGGSRGIPVKKRRSRHTDGGHQPRRYFQPL